MISSEENYYDLSHNRMRLWCSTCPDNAEDAKILNYPSVLQNIYCITENGRVYSIINENYIGWRIRNGLPYVNLSCDRERGISLEPFYIKDLMAYNYIANADSYLERGYHASYVDGDPMNCNYKNIVYIGGLHGY